ncbi:MAG: carboxymuconolactone decarboxylase family protein, partial [Wenzhouxiangella sp.]
MSYSVHDKSTAPAEARPLLEKAESAYGFVPNLLGIMAESPALLEAYMTVGQIFEKTDFSPTEQQVVLLAVSADNQCGYC